MNSDPLPKASNAPSSLYRGIATALRKEMLAGRWRPGDRIPTEKELSVSFGVSLGTMRLAILELVKAGLLFRHQGRGTFVAGLRLDLSLERFFRYRRRDARETLLPETRLLGSSELAPDEGVATALGLKRGAKVGWLRRLRLHDDDPFLFHDSYFPLPLWRRMTRCDFAEPNLYRQLQERCDACIVDADEYLTADVAGDEEAAILGIAEGSPLVRLERHSYGFERKKLEFRRSTGRGDRFTYHVRL